MYGSRYIPIKIGTLEPTNCAPILYYNKFKAEIVVL